MKIQSNAIVGSMINAINKLGEKPKMFDVLEKGYEIYSAGFTGGIQFGCEKISKDFYKQVIINNLEYLKENHKCFKDIQG